MDTFSGALAAGAVALLISVLGRYLFKICPGGGFLGGFIVSYLFCALGKLVIPCPGWDILLERFCLFPCLVMVWVPWYWWWYEACSLLAVRTVWLDGDRIRVDPGCYPCLLLGGCFRWVVEAPPKHKVRIVFEEKNKLIVDSPQRIKGPFTQRHSDPHNPKRGEYEITGPGTIQTDGVDVRPRNFLGRERWKYTVTWDTGQKNLVCDPGVCTKG